MPAGLLLATALAVAPPLKVATYAYPKYDRAAALAPLGQRLSQGLGRPVKVVLLATPDALRDALAAGEVDVAMTNLAAWRGVSGRAGVQALAVLDVPAATAGRYRGVLLARRDAGVAALAELAPRAGTLGYAEVLPGSTSGALVQAAALRGAGLSPAAFAQVRQAGTHDGALTELLSGAVQVAALAEEPWRRLQAQNPQRAGELIELWRSDPLPPGPVVCVTSPATPCGRIAELLLEDGAAGAAAALAAGWSETEGARSFRPYAPAPYRPFIEAPTP